MKTKIIHYIESKQMKKNLPILKVGDFITVTYKNFEIINKLKEQNFNGLISCIKKKGLTTRIVILKFIHNEWVQQSFFLHHPNIINIKIIRSNFVRKAKLYYLKTLKKNIEKEFKIK